MDSIAPDVSLIDPADPSPNAANYHHPTAAVPAFPNTTAVSSNDGHEDEDEHVAPAPLARGKLIAFSFGHVMNDLCASCWFTYLLVLMHTTIGLTGMQSATILLSGQFADAIATPLVGIYSDKAVGITCGSFYFGRRHLTYTIGSVLVLTNFFFLFCRCVLCDILGTDEMHSNVFGIVTYYSVAAALFNVGWAGVQVSHMALIPELTEDETTRVVLNSVRYSATVASNLLVFFILFLLIHVWSLPKETQFHDLGLVCIAIGVVTSIIFLLGTEEKRPKREQVIWEAKRRKKLAARANQNVNEAYHTLVNDEESDAPALISSASFQQKSSVPTVTIDPIVEEIPPSPPADKGQPESVLLSPSLSGSADTPRTISSTRSTPIEIEDVEDSAVVQPPPEQFTSNVAFENTLTRRLQSLPVQFITYRCWMNMPEYWIAGLIYMCTRLVVNVSQVCLPFYILNTLELDHVYITVLPCTVYVSSLIAAGLMKNAHLRYGTKPVFCFGYLLICGSCVAMLFLHTAAPWVWLIYPCSMALGLGNGTIMVCNGSLTASLIGSRTNYAAFVYGSFSFGDKLSTGIVLFLLQTFNPDTGEYIRYALALPTIAFSVLAVILILTKVDLDEWRYRHTLPNANEQCARDIAKAAGIACEFDPLDESEDTTKPMPSSSSASCANGVNGTYAIRTTNNVPPPSVSTAATSPPYFERDASGYFLASDSDLQRMALQQSTSLGANGSSQQRFPGPKLGRV